MRRRTSSGVDIAPQCGGGGGQGATSFTASRRGEACLALVKRRLPWGAARVRSAMKTTLRLLLVAAALLLSAGCGFGGTQSSTTTRSSGAQVAAGQASKGGAQTSGSASQGSPSTGSNP